MLMRRKRGKEARQKTDGETSGELPAAARPSASTRKKERSSDVAASILSSSHARAPSPVGEKKGRKKSLREEASDHLLCFREGSPVFSSPPSFTSLSEGKRGWRKRGPHPSPSTLLSFPSFPRRPVVLGQRRQGQRLRYPFLLPSENVWASGERPSISGESYLSPFLLLLQIAPAPPTVRGERVEASLYLSPPSFN